MIDAPALDGIVRQFRPAATVAETRPLDRGNRKQTTVVRFADSDPVVVQQSADRETIRTEARLLEAITDRTSVPVARPLASDGGWLVMTLVPGAGLHGQFTELTATDRRRIVEQFGRALADVHDTFEFETYGPISADGGGLQTVPTGREEIAGGIRLASGATASDWEQWLTTFGEAAIARLPPEFDGLKPELRTAVAHPTVCSSSPRLFPWDFRPGNALVDGGRLSAILDWEGPLAADPALSYAKAEYLVADWYVSRDVARTLRTAFQEGYESVREPPRLDAAHRVAAIASTAVDSRGAVTNPRYPPVDREEAVEFHRESLRRAL